MHDEVKNSPSLYHTFLGVKFTPFPSINNQMGRGGMTSRSTCILNQKRHTGTSTYTYRFCSTRNFQNVYLKLSNTGHITTGSWKDRGSQCIQLVKVLNYIFAELVSVKLCLELLLQSDTSHFHVR